MVQAGSGVEAKNAAWKKRTIWKDYFFQIDLHSLISKTTRMKAAQKIDAVHFSVKGQVVIPRWLRREYHIERGTRAMVYSVGDHIAVKPITAAHYRKLRGSLKGTGVLKALMEERKTERER